MKSLICISLLFLSFFSFSISLAQSSYTSCDTVTWDDGGVSSDYSANYNHTYTYCRSENYPYSTSELHFMLFDIHPSDSVCIYAGADVSSPLIGCYSGSELHDSVLTIMDSCITLEFATDDSLEAAGWQAHFTCGVACQAIDVSAPDTNHIFDAYNISRTCKDDSFRLAFEYQFIENDTYYHQDLSTSTFELIYDSTVISTDVGMDSLWYILEPGKYTFTTILTDTIGCEHKEDFVLFVSRPPLVTLTLPDTVCAEEEPPFYAHNVPYTYILEFGVGGDTIFLPDGDGTSYSSTINTDSIFPPGLDLGTDNLQAVCVNIEHSWMRDLEIALVCPSGDSIILHDHPGQIGGEVYLGEPIDGDIITPIPGTGWDYCWRMDAINDTWIEYANTFLPDTLPEGDYKPYEDFNDLASCLVAGDWELVVTDLWSSDNGVVFSWNLFFNDALLGEEGFSSGIEEIVWNDDAVDFAFEDTTSYYFDTAGTYTFHYHVADSFGCAFDTTFTVEAMDITINAGEGFTISECEPDDLLFFDMLSSDPDSFGVWSGPSILGSGYLGNYDFDLHSNGTYYYIASNPFCFMQDSAEVIVDNHPNPAPPTVNPDDPFCEGVLFSYTYWGVDSLLLFENEMGSPLPYPYPVSTSSTIYAASISNEGCHSDTVLVPIMVRPSPDASFVLHNYRELETFVPFNLFAENTSSGTDLYYQWFLDNIYEDNTTDLYGAEEDQGDHTIMLVATDSSTGCVDTAIFDYFLREWSFVKVPNVFTPNGDNSNENFRPEVIGASFYNVEIYNRWGLRVFECTSGQDVENCYWDGENHPEGTYYYVIEMKDDLGEVFTDDSFKGYFTLIR